MPGTVRKPLLPLLLLVLAFACPCGQAVAQISTSRSPGSFPLSIRMRTLAPTSPGSGTDNGSGSIQPTSSIAAGDASDSATMTVAAEDAPESEPVKLITEDERLGTDKQPEPLAPVPMDGVPAAGPDPDASWSPDAPPVTGTPGACLYRGCYYVQIDAMFMSRTAGGQNTGLAIDLSSPNEPTLRVPASLGWAPMARLTFGGFLGQDAKNRDHSLEFTFLGLGNWNRRKASPRHLILGCLPSLIRRAPPLDLTMQR